MRGLVRAPIGQQVPASLDAEGKAPNLSGPLQLQPALAQAGWIFISLLGKTLIFISWSPLTWQRISVRSTSYSSYLS